MKRLLFFGLGLGLLAVLVACGGNEEVVETPLPTAVSEPLSPTNTPSPAPTNTPAPTPTPSPTPLPPLLEVDDQILGPDGVIRLTAVQSPVRGIVALYLTSGRALGDGDLLAHTAVYAGTTRDLTLEIDPDAFPSLTDSLQVALHIAPATAEDEDAFDPAVDDLLLLTEFQIDNQAIQPIIELSQESVGQDGLLIIERVVTPVEGWLALYNNNDASFETLIAFAPLAAGENEQLPLYLRWHEAETDMLALIYRDDGEELGRFEATDTPLMFAGAPATTELSVRLPAQITALDQPVLNGRVFVPRVVSDGPGFVVVYQSENNQPGFIIGSRYVPHGVTSSLVVSVTQAAVTPQMMLFLHSDGNDNQTFDFPGPDEPQLSGGQQFFVPFNTEVDSYLVTADQPLGEGNQVVVPLVVAAEPVWVVVHAPVGEEEGDEEGNTAVVGDILGQTRLPVGVSQNVIIELELDNLPTDTSTLFAALYQVNDPAEAFDPATNTLLLRRREPLGATFSLLATE